jgi:glyceraldehyde-3-phosphate dehydrogenase/erythrose-4-phosphate dehydrogenase
MGFDIDARSRRTLMTTRVAINGLGRIGRAVLKIILDTPGLELAAVNDIAAPDNLAYLLKYDTRRWRPMTTA